MDHERIYEHTITEFPNFENLKKANYLQKDFLCIFIVSVFNNRHAWVKEHSLLCMSAQPRADISNNDWFLLFLTSKRATFPLFSGIPVLSGFLCFVRFGSLKKCSGLRLFYAFWTENWPENMCRYISTILTFSVWPFWTSFVFFLFPIPVKCMPSEKEKWLQKICSSALQSSSDHIGGAFHDRSTKVFQISHHHIFDFIENWRMGLFGPRKQFWQFYARNVNGSWDIASGNSARSRCRPIFEGFYRKIYRR